LTRKKKVFVTGANGFVGSRVCADLVGAGWAVSGLVRRIDSRLPAGVEPIVGDFDDPGALKRGMLGTSAVVHLAGRAHVMKETAADPLGEFRRVNVEGTRRVLEEALCANVERFIFISSVKAVGEASTQPWTETTPPRPVDPYGISKLEAERLIRDRTVGTALCATILRLPIVYGPGVKANMLRLFELVDRGVPLPFASVRNKRSLAFLGNVSFAIVKVLSSPNVKSELFFVCDRECLSTPALIREIGKALGRPARLLPFPSEIFEFIGSASGKLSTVLPLPSLHASVNRLLGSLEIDASKLTSVTGFTPPFSLAEGLAETAAWFRTASTRA
jgi:nucleoside-diphosphate-sugar epimerase